MYYLYKRLYRLHTSFLMHRYDSKYVLFSLLALCVLCLFADQNLLAPNLSIIAKEFHFDDAAKNQKLGADISLGFFAVGGIVAILIGYLADVTDRCLLLTCIVFLGEVSCLLTFFSRTYEELFLCRIFTGISIGGAVPVVYSMIADMFNKEQRIYYVTLIGIAASGGISLGQFISGMIGPIYGWRLPFLLVSLPAIVISFLIAFAKEPKRGSTEEMAILLNRNKSNLNDISEYKETVESVLHIKMSHDATKTTVVTAATLGGPNLGVESKEDNEASDVNILCAEQSPNCDIKQCLSSDTVVINLPASHTENEDVSYSEHIDCAKLADLIQTKTVICILLQGLPGCIPWGIIYVFMNDYFSNEKGLSIQKATYALTLIGIFGLVGQLFGGYFGEILHRKDKRYQCFLMAASPFLSVFPLLYLINTDMPGSGIFYFTACVTGFVSNIAGPNVKSVLQSVCSPETRGTGFALFNLSDELGKGLGPTVVVAMIKQFQGDRCLAFNVLTSFWFVCSFFLLLTCFTVYEDERMIQMRIRSSLLSTYRSINNTLNGAEVDVIGRSGNLIHSISSDCSLGSNSTCSSSGNGINKPLLVQRQNENTPILKHK